MKQFGINLQYMNSVQMKQFEERAISYIQRNRMLLPAERVVAGISGGADSVCLLFVLLEWKRRFGLEPAVVHVHHGIRPEASQDAAFVEQLCGEHNIPFYLRKADIPRLAKEQKCSEEEAGRAFRYQAFAVVADEFGATRIAVAHNLNDRAETMLFHLFRGSGLKGLAGIAPVRGEIIRPLLFAGRDEIEAYLAGKGQAFCQDRTNEEDTYTRNRIRHHVISYVEEQVVSDCVRHMGEAAELIAQTEDYLQLQTAQARATCVRRAQEGGFVVDCDTFTALHPLLQGRVAHMLLTELSPGQKDIARVHVEDLCGLLVRSGNRRISLPFGIEGRRIYGEVHLGYAAARSDDTEGMPQVTFQVLSADEIRKNGEKTFLFPENEYTKWFDYDKMKRSPILRCRQEGDYLTIRGADGGLHHKKLKDYMVTEKIPAQERDRVPVLAEDSHVLWLVGYRISEYYKVREDTKRILQVTIMTAARENDTEE